MTKNFLFPEISLGPVPSTPNWFNPFVKELWESSGDIQVQGACRRDQLREPTPEVTIINPGIKKETCCV